MSNLLKGNKRSQKGSRVPTELLPTAIRYEAARAAIFKDWGNLSSANDCLSLKRHYERRAMEETVDVPPCQSSSIDGAG